MGVSKLSAKVFSELLL